MHRRWTLEDMTQASGRSARTVKYLLAAGLLPGYRADQHRWANVPWEIGEAFAQVLRTGAYSRQFAGLVRDNPEEALATVHALEALVKASLTAEQEQPEITERAA